MEPSGLRDTLQADPALAGRLHLLPEDARSDYLLGFADQGSTNSDRRANMITAGQAFHWFATNETLQEFARCAAPRGMLALFWNHLDVSQPALRWVEACMSGFYRDAAENQGGDQVPRAITGEWAKAFGLEPQRILDMRGAASMDLHQGIDDARRRFRSGTGPVVVGEGGEGNNPVGSSLTGTPGAHGWHPQQLLHSVQLVACSREQIRSRVKSISVVAAGQKQRRAEMLAWLDVAMGVGEDGSVPPVDGLDDLGHADVPPYAVPGVPGACNDDVVRLEEPFASDCGSWQPWDWHGACTRHTGGRIEDWRADAPTGQLFRRAPDASDGSARWWVQYFSETFLAR